MKETDGEMKFEQALSRLEQIVKLLESGNIPLEDLITLFDEGTALVRFCTGRLDAAEEKIRLLHNDGKGLKEESFDE